MWLFYYIRRNHGKDACVQLDRGLLFGWTVFSRDDSRNAVQ